MRKLVCTAGLSLALAIGMFAGSTASARGLNTGFYDRLFTSSDAGARAIWLDHAVDARAGIVHIYLHWPSFVGPQPPAMPTNPADPAYNFGSLDDAVHDATARGLQVMFSVSGTPPWAEGKNRPNWAPAGTWKPDPHDYGQFAQALAARYSGSFLGLPRVRYFEAWNEPNLTVEISPQWVGKRPTGPRRYRRLLNAFYTGIHKAQPSAQVIGGATAPFGDPRKKPRIKNKPRMRPLVFLRNLFCLKRNLKPTKCGSKPHLDILSHHPINFLNGPHYSAINPNDVEVADFHNVRRVLKAAERAHHVRPGGKHPLWATELWWYTKPPSPFGIPVSREARWLEESMYMLWKQGANAIINFQIRDPDNNRSIAAPSSGVFFRNGNKKPSYTSFRFPFVTHRKGKQKVAAWGKAPRAGKVKIQRKTHKGWKTVDSVEAQSGELFRPALKLRGKAKLRAKIGGVHSLVWRQT